jgi:hypothetical protein
MDWTQSLCEQDAYTTKAVLTFTTFPQSANAVTSNVYSRPCGQGSNYCFGTGSPHFLISGVQDIQTTIHGGRDARGEPQAIIYTCRSLLQRE